jgi:hypothetical protein
MHKLVELIARSRKVELGIVGSPLFAAFLSPEQLEQIKRDHADPEAILQCDNGGGQ